MSVSALSRAKNTLLSVATTIRLGKQKESLSATVWVLYFELYVQFYGKASRLFLLRAATP